MIALEPVNGRPPPVDAPVVPPEVFVPVVVPPVPVVPPVAAPPPLPVIPVGVVFFGLHWPGG